MNSSAKDLNDGKKELPNSRRELEISGKISRLYIQGLGLTLRGLEFPPSKLRDKSYVIVPIKDNHSEIQYVKVPVYKLGKIPSGKSLGTAKCKAIVSPEGILEKELDKWSIDKEELFQWKQVECRRSNASEIPEIAPETTSRGEAAQIPSTSGVAPLKTSKILQTNTDDHRFLAHLITLTDPYSEKRRKKINLKKKKVR